MPRKYTCSNADRTSGRGSEKIPRPAVDFLRRSDLPCQELVNGSNVEPVVYTVCPGPIWPGRTGPVAGGQTMSVAHVANGPGYTGPQSQVYAWFDQDSSGTRPNMLKFTEYGAEQTIPTGVRVPCDGTGQAQFNPCPYLAPCVFGSSPGFVKVR